MADDFESLVRRIVREEFERLSLQQKNQNITTVKKEDEWGGFEKAKEKTGLSRPKIQALIDAGEIQAYQKGRGGKWNINISSILRFSESEAKARQKENRKKVAI